MFREMSGIALEIGPTINRIERSAEGAIDKGPDARSCYDPPSVPYQMITFGFVPLEVIFVARLEFCGVGELIRIKKTSR